jgi:Holliday junction resolvase
VSPLQIELPGTPRGKGRKKLVSDEALIGAYAELKSVHAVGKRFGIHGSSVHERLSKLGANRKLNLFSAAEEDRLRSEYWIAAATGKLAELAADLGRTKFFICRKARELGLTDSKRKKTWLAVWKYVGEESARIIFEQFKQSPLGLGKFCAKRGYDDLGFAQCMKLHFFDEWEHVIEAKQIKQTKYKYGRQFEYRVRDHLRAEGYFAQRSPASKTPIDITAIKPGVVLLVQCKRNASLRPGEWNELFDLAMSCGAIPVMASTPTGRGITYHRMLARKDAPGRQPMEPFTP